MSDEIKAMAREWLDKYERAPDDDPTYSLTEDCLSVLLQAAFERGRQVRAGHVTRIIAELNDTWKELEHAGFTLLAAKVSTLAKELSNMIERSLAQPAASAPPSREHLGCLLDADHTTCDEPSCWCVAVSAKPDVFDFVGQKIATAFWETVEALQGFEEHYRMAGESALEEFWFRATGKHADIDEKLARKPASAGSREGQPTEDVASECPTCHGKGFVITWDNVNGPTESPLAGLVAKLLNEGHWEHGYTSKDEDTGEPHEWWYHTDPEKLDEAEALEGYTLCFVLPRLTRKEQSELAALAAAGGTHDKP